MNIKKMISDEACNRRNTWQLRLLFIAIIAFLFLLFSPSKSFAARYTAEYSNDEGTYRLSFDYSDQLFLTSVSGNDSELAKASIAMSALAYTDDYETPDKLLSLISRMGFRKINCVNYLEQYSYDDCDHVAYTTAEKEFIYNGEKYVIVLCVVRGTVGFNSEWYSNFNVGINYNHQGFYLSAVEPENSMSGRLKAIKTVDKNHKIAWITGHSRGAAVSNIISGELALLTSTISPNHVFSYNFACPSANGLYDANNPCIHNYNNPYDLIPEVPPQEWGFGRYGQNNDNNEYFYDDNFSYNFELSHDRELKTTRVDIVMDILKSIIPDQYALNKDPMHMAVDLIIKALIAPKSNVSAIDIVRKYDDVANFAFSIADFYGDFFRDPVQALGDLATRMWNFASENRRMLATSMVGLEEQENRKKEAEFLEESTRVLTSLLDQLSGQIQGITDGHTPETYMQWIGGDDYSFVIAKKLPSIYRIPTNVTKLLPYQFEGNNDIVKLIIPASIHEISVQCFSFCGSLEEVVFEGKIDCIKAAAFCGCEKLKRLEFRNGVNIIDDFAFQGCISLTSVDIPDGIQEIRAGAFEHTGIVSFTFPRSITRIYPNILGMCDRLVNVNIPDTVTSIGGFAFSGCESLESIAIPDSVKELGDGAFGACINLRSITLPWGITTLGHHVFANCQNLSYVGLPSYLAEIGDYAFYDCPSLHSISIPPTVTKIGEGAFYQCVLLSDVELPSGLTTLGSLCFGDCVNLKHMVIPNYISAIEKKTFLGCTALGMVSLPATISFIDDEAFSGCTNLLRIDCWSNTTRISDNAFAGCNKLIVCGYSSSAMESFAYGKKIPFVPITFITAPDLVIPDGLTVIEAEAFEGIGVQSISIGKNVQSIGNNAFSNCVNLKFIHIPEGISFDDNTFSGSYNSELVVCGKKGSFAEIFAGRNNIYFLPEW